MENACLSDEETLQREPQKADALARKPWSCQRVATVLLLPAQVVEETHLILKEYGFRFVRRGPIFVKGKGELLTYFMKGREKQGSFINGSSVTLPHQVVDSS